MEVSEVGEKCWLLIHFQKSLVLYKKDYALADISLYVWTYIYIGKYIVLYLCKYISIHIYTYICSSFLLRMEGLLMLCLYVGNGILFVLMKLMYIFESSLSLDTNVF